MSNKSFQTIGAGPTQSHQTWKVSVPALPRATDGPWSVTTWEQVVTAPSTGALPLRPQLTPLLREFLIDWEAAKFYLISFCLKLKHYIIADMSVLVLVCGL